MSPKQDFFPEIDEDEDFTPDDFNLTEDETALDLEASLNDERRAKEEAALAQQEQLEAQAQEAANPDNWTFEQTKQYFKDNPPQNPQEEQEAAKLMHDKKKFKDSLVEEEKSLMSKAGDFFKEGVLKSLARSIQQVPVGFESIIQVGLDNLRQRASDQLREDGQVFGATPEQIERSQQPEVAARIKRNEKIYERLTRAIDNSKRIQARWIEMANTGVEAKDPEIFKGDFMENPSWTRAVSIGMEATPLLGMAAATSFYTKSPTVGAAILGALEAAGEHQAAREAGKSVNQANLIFGANAVALTALETVPLTGFMKGGKLPIRMFRGAVQEGGEEALQTLWTNSVAKIGYDETRNLTEGIVESVVAGTLSGGVLGTLSPARGVEIDRIITKARENGVDVDSMMEAAGNQVKENAPKLKTILEDFNKRVVESERGEAGPKKEGDETKQPKGETKPAKSETEPKKNEKVTDAVSEDFGPQGHETEEDLGTKPRPEKVKDLRMIAIRQDGKVYASKPGADGIFTHSDLVLAKDLDFDKVEPGFIDKNGKFVKQISTDEIVPVPESVPPSLDPAVQRAKENKAESIKFIQAELEKENAARTKKGIKISEQELFAQNYVVENFDEAIDRYTARVKEEYRTNSTNIISADSAKFAIPGMNKKVSGDYHEAGSALAKVIFNNLVQDESTKDKPVLFMAGISGGGKTSGLRLMPNFNFDNYAFVYDTNLATKKSFDSKQRTIDQFNKEKGGNRETQIMYVHRDPLKAWIGVLERAVKQDRVVPILAHVTNAKSFESVKSIQAANPEMEFFAIDNNSDKKGEAFPTALEDLQDFGYTDNELIENAISIAKQFLEKGAIDNDLYQTAIKGLEERAEGISPELFTGIKADTSTEEAGLETKDAGQDQSTEQPEGKRRKFITTVKESPRTAAELAEIIESRYQPISNKATLAAANQIIEQSLDKADELVFSNDPPSALSNAIAQRLVGLAQAEKNWTRAKAIVERTAERNTKLGQTIQALSIYNRLTPEGILQVAEKTIRKARDQVKQKQKLTNFEKMKKTIDSDEKVAKLAERLGIPYLSEELIADLRSRAENISKMPETNEKERRAKAIETALMLKQINKQIPVSFWKKVAFSQTLAQLLNPKTIVRNILGNALFQGAEVISDSIGTALDIAVATQTGKRTQLLPGLKTQIVGFIEEGKKSSEEVLLGINLRKQPTKFDIPQEGVFHNKFGQWLEKTLSFALRVPDRAAYGAAYADTLRKELILHKKNTGETLEEPTLEMIERAHLTGLYRTYQDDNVLSRGFVSLKKFLNAGKDFGLGDMVIKYPRTPSNLLARGIEYSPLGFVNTIRDLAMPLAGYEFDQAKFVRDSARALTGSMFLAGTGWILAQLGIISGKREKDRDVREQLKEVGIRDYQINVSALKRFAMSGLQPEAAKIEKGDILVSYDWMQPLSISMALGANMAIDPRSNVTDKVINLIDRIAEASETLTEQPLVRGIRVVTRRENIFEGFAQVIKDIPASFVPTLLNQVRQLTNNTYRNTRDPNYLKEMYNKTIYRIPGLSATLPERINPRGKPMQMYQNETNNPFNVFLNPAFVNTYQPDETAQFVLDIWQNSGEAIHFPRVAPMTVKLSGQKDRLILRPDEYHDYQAYIGRKTDILFGALRRDKKFMGLPPDEQATKLQRYLTDINSAAKIELFGNRPKRVGKRVISVIRDIHIDMQNIQRIEERRAQEAADEEDFTPDE